MRFDSLKLALTRVANAVGSNPPFNRVRIKRDVIIARDRSISATAGINDDLGVDVHIDHAALVAAAKRMPPDSDVIWVDDALVIKHGRSRVTIKQAPEDVDDVSPILHSDDGCVRIFDRNAYNLAKSLIALREYQAPESIEPAWLGAIIQIAGVLAVIGEGSKIIAWTDDRWFAPAGIIGAIIPQRLSAHLSAVDEPPIEIRLGNNCISAIWADAAFSTSLLAGSAPETIANFISNWQEPKWAVTTEFCDAAQIVTGLSHGNIAVSNGEIFGKSKIGETTVSAHADMPIDTSMLISQTSLDIMAKTADKWQIDAPNPSPFIAGTVRGIVAVMQADV